MIQIYDVLTNFCETKTEDALAEARSRADTVFPQVNNLNSASNKCFGQGLHSILNILAIFFLLKQDLQIF